MLCSFCSNDLYSVGSMFVLFKSLYKKVLERSFSRSSVPKVDRSGQSETQLSTLWGLGRE
jgi:hypothetical protein